MLSAPAWRHGHPWATPLTLFLPSCFARDRRGIAEPAEKGEDPAKPLSRSASLNAPNFISDQPGRCIPRSVFRNTSAGQSRKPRFTGSIPRTLKTASTMGRSWCLCEPASVERVPICPDSPRADHRQSQPDKTLRPKGDPLVSLCACHLLHSEEIMAVELRRSLASDKCRQWVARTGGDPEHVVCPNSRTGGWFGAGMGALAWSEYALK